MTMIKPKTRTLTVLVNSTWKFTGCFDCFPRSDRSKTSDILVMKIILVIVTISFLSHHFYYYLVIAFLIILVIVLVSFL
jgi:hypothetical protein